MTQLLVVIAGDPPPPVAEEFGTYHPWFTALAEAEAARLSFADVRQGPISATTGQYDGVVISGSPSSVTEWEPWMSDACKLISDCMHADLPLLGVCFGHQLIAHTIGAKVRENPNGWELGTYAIRLEGSDPLFAGHPETFAVNLSHRDEVDISTLPSEVRVLARSDKTAVQAFSLGDKVRAVQFHPEFTGPITHSFLQCRQDKVAEDAHERGVPSDHPRHMLDQIRDAPHGEAVMGNFIKHFVSGGKQAS